MPEIMDRVIEELAELEHIQWQHWAKVGNPEHPLINTPYSQLTEDQKEQDRIWARKVISVNGLAVVEDNWLDKQKSTTTMTRYRCNSCGVLYKKWIDAEECCSKQAG